jgi:hypothetical protein
MVDPAAILVELGYGGAMIRCATTARVGVMVDPAAILVGVASRGDVNLRASHATR